MTNCGFKEEPLLESEKVGGRGVFESIIVPSGHFGPQALISVLVPNSSSSA